MNDCPYCEAEKNLPRKKYMWVKDLSSDRYIRFSETTYNKIMEVVMAESFMARVDRMLREAGPDAVEVHVQTTGVGEEAKDSVMAELLKANYPFVFSPNANGKGGVIAITVNPPKAIRSGPQAGSDEKNPPVTSIVTAEFVAPKDKTT